MFNVLVIPFIGLLVATCSSSPKPAIASSAPAVAAMNALFPMETDRSRVRDSAQAIRGALSFDARATLGNFVGTTDFVRGAMTGGSDLRAVRGWVEASVATLVTGDRKRDKDLRKSMEVGRYPTMRFDVDRKSVV